VCVPDCSGSNPVYLVTWNGHGDALGLWRQNADGTLTLANSYTYTTWGTPTMTVASGFADLGFRFLYVGGSDVQWDNDFGLGLLYMHARHYSPAVGRFLQPDPARAETNPYAYAKNSPTTLSDCLGTFGGFVGVDAMCRNQENNSLKKAKMLAKRIFENEASPTRDAGHTKAIYLASKGLVEAINKYDKGPLPRVPWTASGLRVRSSKDSQPTPSFEVQHPVVARWSRHHCLVAPEVGGPTVWSRSPRLRIRFLAMTENPYRMGPEFAACLLALTGFARYAQRAGIDRRVAADACHSVRATPVVGDEGDLAELLMRRLRDAGFDAQLEHLAILVDHDSWSWHAPLERLHTYAQLLDGTPVPAEIAATAARLLARTRIPARITLPATDALDRAVLRWFGRGGATLATRGALDEHRLRTFFADLESLDRETRTSLIALARREAALLGNPIELPDVDPGLTSWQHPAPR